MKDQLNLRVFIKNRSTQRRKMAKRQLFKDHLQRVCMDWVDKPQNCKDLYGILQLQLGSHLNNFPLKTFKLGWVAFHLVTFQLKCLDFQFNQYQKLVPVLSRFCNWPFQLGTFQGLGSINRQVKHNDAQDRKRKCCLSTQDLLKI